MADEPGAARDKLFCFQPSSSIVLKTSVQSPQHADIKMVNPRGTGLKMKVISLSAASYLYFRLHS